MVKLKKAKTPAFTLRTLCEWRKSSGGEERVMVANCFNW